LQETFAFARKAQGHKGPRRNLPTVYCKKPLLVQETFACARNLCFCKQGTRAQGHKGPLFLFLFKFKTTNQNEIEVMLVARNLCFFKKPLLFKEWQQGKRATGAGALVLP